MEFSSYVELTFGIKLHNPFKSKQYFAYRPSVSLAVLRIEVSKYLRKVIMERVHHFDKSRTLTTIRPESNSNHEVVIMSEAYVVEELAAGQWVFRKGKRFFYEIIADEEMVGGSLLVLRDNGRGGRDIVCQTSNIDFAVWKGIASIPCFWGLKELFPATDPRATVAPKLLAQDFKVGDVIKISPLVKKSVFLSKPKRTLVS